MQGFSAMITYNHIKVLIIKKKKLKSYEKCNKYLDAKLK